MKVELGCSNYATKADFKDATGIDTSDFAKKIDLTNSKSDVYNLEIEKLKNAASNLIHLKIKVDKL